MVRLVLVSVVGRCAALVGEKQAINKAAIAPNPDIMRNVDFMVVDFFLNKQYIAHSPCCNRAGGGKFKQGAKWWTTSSAAVCWSMRGVRAPKSIPTFHALADSGYKNHWVGWICSAFFHASCCHFEWNGLALHTSKVL